MDKQAMEAKALSAFGRELLLLYLLRCWLALAGAATKRPIWMACERAR